MWKIRFFPCVLTNENGTCLCISINQKGYTTKSYSYKTLWTLHLLCNLIAIVPLVTLLLFSFSMDRVKFHMLLLQLKIIANAVSFETFINGIYYFFSRWYFTLYSNIFSSIFSKNYYSQPNIICTNKAPFFSNKIKFG